MAKTATQPDSRAEALVSAYERAGYLRVQPAILQPAEPFLDLAGEDIRSRMYLTTDSAGNEFCLRPDFTIAVSRDRNAALASVNAELFRARKRAQSRLTIVRDKRASAPARSTSPKSHCGGLLRRAFLSASARPPRG